MRASTGPMPGSRRTGSGASSDAASAAPITAKPRGLSRPAAILASNRLAAKADRDGDADVAFHRAGEAGQHHGGRRAVQRLGAGEVQDSLVDRQRLEQGGQGTHQGAHLAGDGDVFGEVGADHHCVRTGLQRLEHRHGAAHAVDARDIAGRGDHAAGAAADDDGFRCQFRAVALFHAGVEGVAVDMREGQREQFGVGDDACTAAGGAGSGSFDDRRAIAAEGRVNLSRAARGRGRDAKWRG